MTVIRGAFAAALAGTLFAAMLAAEAQPPGKLPRIGLLDSSTPDQARLAWWDGFLGRMSELGYVEGRTVAFERRWARGEIKRLSGLTAELVGLNVDIIVTAGTPALVAAHAATTSIPIVMAPGGDPVELGIVPSLGRPGGNVTGVASQTADLTAKRLELLRELLPNGSRMAVLWDRNSGSAHIAIRETLAAADRVGLKVRAYAASAPGDFDQAFSAMARDRAGGLDITTSPMFFTERRRIASLALKQGLPTMVGAREYAEAGALASYGPDYVDLFRRVAAYVDRILKGAKPAELPIEQPTRFQLVINLKTARALGLTIPQSLLLRADQVIQ
jgi:putative tryptophan/tyrosine transport system substrate-binding protein